MSAFQVPRNLADLFDYTFNSDFVRGVIFWSGLASALGPARGCCQHQGDSDEQYFRPQLKTHCQYLLPAKTSSCKSTEGAYGPAGCDFPPTASWGKYWRRFGGLAAQPAAQGITSSCPAEPDVSLGFKGRGFAAILLPNARD